MDEELNTGTGSHLSMFNLHKSQKNPMNNDKVMDDIEKGIPMSNMSKQTGNVNCFIVLDA